MIIVLTALVAASGSWALGWWTAAVIGLALPVLAPKLRRPALVAGLATALGWGSLLAAQALVAPIAPLASLLGTVVPVGPVGIVALTLAFGALLAASAAGVVGALRRPN